jgi:hypothetical protein
MATMPAISNSVARLANAAVWFQRRSVHTGNDLPGDQAHGSVVKCGAVQL